MGGPRGGGSIPLPRISGFSEEFFYSYKLTSDEERLMSGVLGNNRFQKGNRAARSYANLVVLFRLLLFYSPLKRHARFWEWIAKDWGIIVDSNRAIVSKVANFYSDARHAAHGASEKRLSLLVRLVDEWLMIRPRPEISYSEEVDDSIIKSTRTEWLNIRDWHVDMLMDSKLPAGLAGIEPPAKMVTSLWAPDPEVAALLKEIKATRRPKSLRSKVGTPDSLTARTQSAGPELERKRKATLSGGDIYENESAPGSNVSAYDDRCFTPVLENAQLESICSTTVDHLHKRGQFSTSSSSTSKNHYISQPSRTVDLIDFTARAHHTLPPSREPAQGQPLGKPPPAPAQLRMIRFTDVQAAATPDPRQDLSAQLQNLASQNRRRQEEIRARVEAEATGRGRPDAAGDVGLVATDGRETYESRLREVEARVAALERAHHDEASWARAMGRFLSDANGKSVRSLQEVFSALDTLQAVSSTLLENARKREE
ncbi:hypothetical protein IF1G_00824 [Cordyceps javanica]|uniref:Uncharacterized protein n=1 Tax=Cordyceps javanica TaxID=43265 RepID=A0A545WDM7_9HYPO|nr:hypothetical protein IF1G_00824 [Cordyceps javanica]TQW12066.1 hypothetical protein IF2G_00797 [Cordyceps javanica]